MTTVGEQDPVISTYFIYEKVLVVIFSNAVIQISAPNPMDTRFNLEILVETQYVHICNRTDYITYNRNSLPKIFQDMIESVLSLLL